tara:strand:- start:66 stop:272 length:207 start_codon:yes stop_codon:yes gene_type:complete
MLKHLLVEKGKNVNASNLYGFTALGFCVKAAGDAATLVSAGKVPKASVEGSMRSIAFLMRCVSEASEP